ncbi:MAG: hypothetical protein KVP17_000469 [Porospora cf. gigantea B]|uniref:uncharacterized protein n=1 Tax=Porospora cf. gigantea B TaxID=2853592 RepID=UPI0035719778|nr:MAG: hypothetical protein KVP17_000469 [Porospora cf. gigantea B]
MTDPGIMPRQRNPNNAYDVNLNEFRMGLPARNQDVTYLGHLYKLKYCVSCEGQETCTRRPHVPISKNSPLLYL